MSDDLLAALDRTVELFRDGSHRSPSPTPYAAISPALLEQWKAEHPGAWDPEVGVRWSDVLREDAKRYGAGP